MINDDRLPEDDDLFEEFSNREDSEWTVVRILITCIILIILFGGGYLIYKYIYVPHKERQKKSVEMREKEPIQWIYSKDLDKIGLTLIEEHLYIVTKRVHSNESIDLIHSESCTAKTHICR
jgi:hypothetical protein